VHCLIVQDKPGSVEPQVESSEGLVHQVTCNCCAAPIVGLRYKCVVCLEYDLCEKCESTENPHPIDHPLIKIRVPLPPSFQGIHAVSAGLHQCRGHISRVIVQAQTQTTPEIYQTAESARQNLTILKDQFATQIQVLSEQLVSGANQFKDVVYEKYEEVKSSEFVGEVVRGTTTVLNASMQQAQNAQQKFQQFVQQPNSPVPQPSTSTVTTPPHVQTPSVPVQQTTEQKQPAPAVQESEHSEALKALEEMGFCDSQKNLSLLQRHKGNLDLCLQELLG